MNEEKLKLVRLSDVETQEVSWLWYPYVPAGKLTILEGDPGEGKTITALDEHIQKRQKRDQEAAEDSEDN